MNNITIEKYIVLVCGLRISAIFASEYDIIKVKYFFGSQVFDRKRGREIFGANAYDVNKLIKHLRY